MLAAIHGISAFLAAILLIALVGWVADQVLSDARKLRRGRRRPR